MEALGINFTFFFSTLLTSSSSLALILASILARSIFLTLKGLTAAAQTSPVLTWLDVWTMVTVLLDPVLTFLGREEGATGLPVTELELLPEDL